ncbi:MAG: hypothetical protein R3E46_03505 [Sedimenticolaceae bacterium]
MWIHIGLHKTGTTYLQTMLFANRQWLEACDFYLPLTGLASDKSKHDHASAGHARLMRWLKRPESERFVDIERALMAELEATRCSNVLLTSETFSAPHNRRIIDTIRQKFATGFDIRIIVYLRRQDHWVESFYKEMLGWAGRRETRSLEQFVADEGTELLDYRKRLNPWIKAFGAESVIVKSYEDASAGDGLLVDFLDTLEIMAPAPAGEFARPINYSIDPGWVDLLRAMNGLDKLSKATKAVVTRTLVNASCEKAQGRRTLITPALWQQLSDTYRRKNDRLRENRMQGRCEGLAFPAERPPIEQATQYIDYESAVSLLRDLNSNSGDGVDDDHR